MVIRHIEEHPELANRIFLDVGTQGARLHRQLRLRVRLRCCGFPLIRDHERCCPHWWVLPVLGTIIGYVTNWLAIWMIFEPIEPRRISAAGRCRACSSSASTRSPRSTRRSSPTRSSRSRNIGEELLHGPRADRTRAMIESAAAPRRRPRDRRRCSRGARGGRARASTTRSASRVAAEARRVHDHAARRPGVQPRGRAASMRTLDRRAHARDAVARTSPRCCARRCARTSGCSCLHGAVLGFGAG